MSPRATPAPVNVGDTERWLSAFGGAALGLYGLSRGRLPGLALAAVGGSLLYRGLTGHCSLYQALDLSTATPRGRATSVPAGQGFKVEQSVTINRPAADLYRFWRNFENLGRFMAHLESVKDPGNPKTGYDQPVPAAPGQAVKPVGNIRLKSRTFTHKLRNFGSMRFSVLLLWPRAADSGAV